MELRINKDQVSHIRIYDLHASGYIWCDEIPLKRVFFNSITVQDFYEEGYWWEGYQGFFNVSINKVKNNMKDIDGELYYLPRIEIFCGKEKIETRGFKTIEEAKEYVTINFPNVNVVI